MILIAILLQSQQHYWRCSPSRTKLSEVCQATLFGFGIHAQRLHPHHIFTTDVSATKMASKLSKASIPCCAASKANLRSSQNPRIPRSIIRTKRLTETGKLLQFLPSSTARSLVFESSLYYLERVTNSTYSTNSIKKPKTNRYPSLAGTDPKFRRNHRHALHGTMKALVISASA